MQAEAVQCKQKRCRYDNAAAAAEDDDEEGDDGDGDEVAATAWLLGGVLDSFEHFEHCAEVVEKLGGAASVAAIRETWPNAAVLVYGEALAVCTAVAVPTGVGYVVVVDNYSGGLGASDAAAFADAVAPALARGHNPFLLRAHDLLAVAGAPVARRPMRCCRPMLEQWDQV